MAKKEIDISGWTLEDQKRYKELTQLVTYYDQLQYIFKIKLNSLYGALLNKHFRFYDDRMGESTTGTGRAILRFQCGRTNELLTGIYDHLGEAILYGDTDSTYFNAMFGVEAEIWEEDFATQLDEAVRRADDIAERVNNSYPDFMADSFLCTGDFRYMVKAAREVVSPRGIFVTPKRYVLWLANLDGKPCDKLKVMGLDTKKTILPKYIQVALNDFIERFLKGETWEQLQIDIVAFKNKMLDLDLPELGLPKGVNNVESYTQIYETTGELDSHTPGHVRASMLYNQMLLQNDDRTSMKISSGMKIKVFYLRRPIGKFKSIALPVDEDVTPEWFKAMNIDVDLQITKLVDNPLTNILKAINKAPPTNQSLFADSVLEF